jgi:hypothetical protein
MVFAAFGAVEREIYGMSNEAGMQPVKRPRRHNIAAVFAAAARAGLQVTGAVIKDGGALELTFAQGGAAAALPGETSEDLKKLL